MDKLIKSIDNDKEDLFKFAKNEDALLYDKQKRIYENTLNFLRQFDKTVALSFIATNLQLRGELGSFYDKLVEEFN